MNYLIANDFKKKQIGSIFLKVSPGPELVSLRRRLTEKYATNGIQIVLLKDKEAYGEYKPYIDAKDEKSFEALADAMAVY